MSATNSSISTLYLGTENIIKLTGNSNFQDCHLEVKGIDSRIDKIEAGHYVIRVFRTDTCTITLSRHGKQIFSKQYKTEVIPYPVAIVSGTRDSVIAKSKLLLNPFLSVILPDCHYRDSRVVMSFRSTFISNGDSVFTSTAGYIFSEEQVKLTSQLKKGDKVLFDNIRASCSSGRILALKPFTITIE